MHFLRAYFVYLLFATTICVAQDAAVQQLTRVKDTFVRESAKIAEEQIAAIALAQEQYIATLSAIESRYQADGKLDPLLIVKGERERFAKNRIVEEQDVVKTDALVSRSQIAYMDTLSTAKTVGARKMLSLVQLYENNLDRMQVEFTRQNNLDIALKVKGEREAVREKNEVVAAVKHIEEMNAKAEAIKDAKIDQMSAVVETLQKESAPGKKYQGPAENYIKQRVNKFFDYARGQNWGDTAQLVDPRYTERVGLQTVENQIRNRYGTVGLASGVVGMAGGAMKIRVPNVALDEKTGTATINPEIVVNNNRQGLQRMVWIEYEGDWYLTLEPGRFLNQGQQRNTPDQQRDRSRQRRP